MTADRRVRLAPPTSWTDGRGITRRYRAVQRLRLYCIGFITGHHYEWVTTDRIEEP